VVVAPLTIFVRRSVAIGAYGESDMSMSNIVSGRQLRTARIFAGLTQAQFAKAVGIDEQNLRY